MTLSAVCLGALPGVTGWRALVQVSVAFALVVWGVWAVLRGRQHTVAVLPSLRGLPANQPVVLFLRAFTDDAGLSRVAALRWLWLLFGSTGVTPSMVRTEEDQVARAVLPFGRMVALGRPSDELPRLGAERSYASDEEWRAEVLATLDRARLVVLVAGAGRSLAWEVGQVVGRVHPTRVILLVARDEYQYEQFRSALGDRFPRRLPSYPRPGLWQRVLRGRYVRAAIWFDADWTPHLGVLDGRAPFAGIGRRTQRVLRRVLRPVYRRAGVPFRATPTVDRPEEVNVVIALIATFWLGLAMWWVLLIGQVDDVIKALGGDQYGEAGSESGVHDVSVLHIAAGMWPLWVVLVPGLAMWLYRVWCGGPIAITLARVHCLMLPVLVLTGAVLAVLFFANMEGNAESVDGEGRVNGILVLFALGLALVLALAGFEWMVLYAAALLALCVVGFGVATALLIRYDVREWIDSRL
ncbi:hypothetical protein [Streptomyces buecherae]|uniref:hypothetical protein n=1 Tax=Streptomyces buecherae TaxID=2763006 RepID=UPI003660CD8F